jgi:hypothetical protein
VDFLHQFTAQGVPKKDKALLEGVVRWPASTQGHLRPMFFLQLPLPTGAAFDSLRCDDDADPQPPWRKVGSGFPKRSCSIKELKRDDDSI